MAEPGPTLTSAQRGASLPTLDRLAPPPSEPDVRAWIESRSAPSDIVVELHGRGGWVARAAAERLRRALDMESIALTQLIAELVLRPPDLRHLDAAFTAFADQLRAGMSLRDTMERGFGSRCASCGGPVVIQEFVWDGDARAPSRRSYRCGQCLESRTGDARTVPVDREDVALARSMDGKAARARLIDRFPIPDRDHELPDQLLDLYTPRALEAIAGVIDRIETELRAPGIQAALRLSLVQMVLPASKLNSFPGRVAQPRIVAGRLRSVGDRQWRERNPWMLLEDGYRTVRGFVQRLEMGHTRRFHARFGPDLIALREGTANVVVGDESVVTGVPPGSGDRSVDPSRAKVRLLLSQPPVHWSPENVGFAYLATSLALGHEAASHLPMDAVFEAPTRTDQRSEWARDAIELRRALSRIRPHLATDGTCVTLLDRQPSAVLVASVLGAVGAGFRLRDVSFAESGQDITGAIELTLPGGPPPVDRGLPLRDSTGERAPTSDTGPLPPFDPDELRAAIAELGVAVLQARGEPARYERLLGEVLLGLDRQGHLRRLTSLWPDSPWMVAATPGADGASDRDPTPGLGSPAREAVGASSGRGRGGSWRDPGRPVRASDEERAPIVAHEPSNGSVRPGGIPSDSATSAAGDRAAGTERGPAGPALAAGSPDRHPLRAGASEPPIVDPSGQPVAPDQLQAVDPVRVTLDSIAAELHRPGHPRLVEVEPGRWWLNDRADIERAHPPLSDRVEWAVFSLLSTSGGIAEAGFSDRIVSMFRGHDAPDEELIRTCVESYRMPIPETDGLVGPSQSLEDLFQEHGELVVAIGELGHRLGLRVWISRREQRRLHDGRLVGDLLSEAEQKVYLPLVTAGPADALEQVDCIWYLRGKATFLFEVEWTAMLGEPVLRRGAAIPASDTMVRFLVIPSARTDLLRLKLARSPLVRERLEQDNWHILKSEHLRTLIDREDPSLDDFAPLLGLDPTIERLGEQLSLFSQGPEDQ